MRTLQILLGIQLLLIISFAGAEEEVICQELTCDLKCDYGLGTDVEGCPTCECREEMCQGVTCSLGKICKTFHLTHTNSEMARCIDPTLPPRCQLPMDSGVCRRKNDVKWFYDTDTNLCQEFPYGGCPGNDNRFEEKAECDEACMTSCGDVMCMMYCEKGFKKDNRGCDICVCEDEDKVLKLLEPQEKSFMVGVGCEEKGEMACDLHCPYGYQKDQYNCEICSCQIPPTCEQKTCENECPLGYRLDKDGCPTCECRQKGECNEFICEMFCEYGRKKDKLNCTVCECNPDPCYTTACPEGTFCMLTNSSTGPTPTCLMLESWSADCPQVSCMLYCEHGFKSDMRGCPVCDCLEQPKAACPILKCRRGCEFGFQKDIYGCDICKCLPNPCKEKVCKAEQVCETMTDCVENVCSHTAVCSESEAIKRVRVHVSYSHEKPLDPQHMDEFLEKMKKSFAEMLKVDEAQIKHMEAKQDNQSVRVTFHVVSDGGEDLVKAWKEAETHLLTKAKESAITYNGQEFVPQHDSLVSLYSSSDAAGPGGGDGAGSATMSIIIACAVIGAALLVVAGIASLYVSKSKKKEQKRKNVIYKKAPEERPEV